MLGCLYRRAHGADYWRFGRGAYLLLAKKAGLEVIETGQYGDLGKYYIQEYGWYASAISYHRGISQSNWMICRRPILDPDNRNKIVTSSTVIQPENTFYMTCKINTLPSPPLLRVFVEDEDLRQIDGIIPENLPLAGHFSHLVNHTDLDSTRWDRYKKLANSYFKVAPLDQADFVLLPYKWHAGDEKATQYAHKASLFNKKLVVFFNDDSSEEISVPNSIIFRTSFYRATRKKNEHALPAWSEDFLANYFQSELQLRKKEHRPIVGFCGFVPTNVSHVRRKSIDYLSSDNRVETNFIIRNQFWAGAIGNEEHMKSARCEFVNNIVQSDYILCARGAGNFSYRLYETLSLCRIPVFIDTDSVLPYEEFIDWKRYCVWVDEKEISHIAQKIVEFHNRLSPQYFVELQIACRKLWEEWLSPEGYFSNFYRFFPDSKAARDIIKIDKTTGNTILDALNQQESSKSVYVYEPEMCQVIEKILKPGFVCADIGAHQGNMCSVMARLVGEDGKVFAFEASPENCDILRQNMTLQGFSSRVITENKAVADASQPSIWLFHGRNSSSYEWNIVGHDVDGNRTGQALQVPAIALDDYFTEGFHIDFIKIDVEGAAAMVFAGMQRILRESRPTLLVEFHDNVEWDGRAKLFNADYTLHHLDGQEINPDLSTSRVYQCLAVPPVKSVLSTSPVLRVKQVDSLNSNPSVLFLNTYYGAFLNSHYARHPQLREAGYAEQKKALQKTFFGDSDFYSSGILKAGWRAEDLIINCLPLQRAWASDNGFTGTDAEIAIAQIMRLRPDVVYLQDLSVATREFLELIRPHTTLIVGQIASPLTTQAYVTGLDIIISSFPHFVKRFREMGITSYYQPLAFDPRVLHCLEPSRRGIVVSFVGGISGIHGKGTQLLEYIASRTSIEFWGYGASSLPPNSPVRARHHGEVWGREMFQTLARSAITVNRHIDVAEKFANNMRLFEATGCGALLITDYKDNLNELFDIGKEVVAYRTPEECVALINYYLAHPEAAAAIASAGQARTLHDHTYTKRMAQTAEILERHLRYKKEKDRFASVDMKGISCGHVNIEKSQINALMISAWKNEKIPERQRALVQKELSEMYKGKAVTPYRVLADIMKQYISPGCSVLEIGCASGYYYEILEYLLNQRINYTGVDYSDALIDMAKSYYPMASFHVADGAQLLFKDREFHLSISSGVLLHTPDYPLQIAETVRVAERFVVAHRTPVCRSRTTQYMKKLAYGVETVEILFNEGMLLDEFRAHGLKLLNKNEYYAAPQQDEYGVTYIFEKQGK